MKAIKKAQGYFTASVILKWLEIESRVLQGKLRASHNLLRGSAQPTW